MNNRRDFLKFFGVGAVVVPLIEGMPSTQNQAVIIEPPKLEIPKPPDISLVSAMPSLGAADATFFLRDRQTGQVTCYEVTGFVQEYRYEVPRPAVGYSREIPSPGLARMTFTVTGKPQISSWNQQGNSPGRPSGTSYRSREYNGIAPEPPRRSW